MTNTQLKLDIQMALTSFRSAPLLDAARDLFDILGYRSDRRIDLSTNTAAAFVAAFDTQGRINADQAQLDQWRSVDMLFQLTGTELKLGAQLRLALLGAEFVPSTYHAFLFFAIQLEGSAYTRSELAAITREVNKLFEMPVSVLFRHGDALTLAIVTHRPNKNDGERDVLEKVTLIKDIALTDTHRAHIEILHDLALPQLAANHPCTNFDGLQLAWQATLDISALNKRFYRELADWYFWALQQVQFPADAEPNAATHNATSVIRLITRLIFVWFLREKGLVPDALFRRSDVDKLLTTLADGESSYYKAILQNLFFATLNQEMNTAHKPDNRKFRNDGQNYNVTNLLRYRALFTQPDTALALFATVPFLNGGLFECLDKPADGSNKPLRIDGFSDRPDNLLHVPNELFFGAEREVDLSAVYDSAAKSKAKVRGLLHILDRYKFTIAENTPIEQEVALAPELLGQVFENLLASYNPETRTTARKQTGSFYTPREIVSYMVDESLLAYLERQLGDSARLVLLPAPETT